MAKNNRGKKVTVWCYGKKYEFGSVRAAKNWCLEGIAGCDGCEKDHYTDILVKLASGMTTACDAQGIPKVNPNETKPLTEEELKDFRRLCAERDVITEELDAARAKYEKLEEEVFQKYLKAASEEIERFADKRNELVIKIIGYNKRGASELNR